MLFIFDLDYNGNLKFVPDISIDFRQIYQTTAQDFSKLYRN